MVSLIDFWPHFPQSPLISSFFELDLWKKGPRRIFFFFSSLYFILIFYTLYFIQFHSIWVFSPVVSWWLVFGPNFLLDMIFSAYRNLPHRSLGQSVGRSTHSQHMFFLSFSFISVCIHWFVFWIWLNIYLLYWFDSILNVFLI